MGARQAFSERYRGGYVQLVSDETYTAAKRKTKEERQKTLQETMGSRSTAAQALVALLMTENVKVTSADDGDTQNYVNTTIMENVTTEEIENVFTIPDYVVMVTFLVVLMTTIWWCGQFVAYKLRRLKVCCRNIFYILHEEDPSEEAGESDQNFGGQVDRDGSPVKI
jgi:cobalamin biosynthesis Mg chelatase CobN